MVEEKVTALVVTLDDSKTEQLRNAFAALPGFDVAVEASKFVDCVGKVRSCKPDVAVVFLEEQPGSGCVTLEEIKKARENLFAFAVSSERSAEVIIKAIRAGADELLSAVPSEEELLKALIRIAERRKTTKSDDEPSSQVVTVYSPNGGTGCTTLAINLATELRRVTNEEVVLVDLDLQGGASPVYLNFNAAYTILDVCQAIDNLDPVLMKGSLHSHESGVQVLAPPANIEDSEAVSPTDIEKIVEALRGLYPYVVIDTSSYLNEVNLVAIEQADTVFFVTDNMVPSVRATQRAFDTFDRLGISQDVFQLVLSKPVPKSDVSAKDMAEALNSEVAFSLPYDDTTAVVAANQGTPLRDINVKSPLAEAIGAVAKAVAGLGDASEPGRGLFGRLFSEART